MHDLGHDWARDARCSSASVVLIRRVALAWQVRKTQEATHFKAVVGEDGKEILEPCSPGDAQGFPSTLDELDSQGLAKRVMPPKISKSDFDRVLVRARPTVGKDDLKVYEDFTREFGEEG
jgi:vacuolar protein-sorting-associated protein 4